MNIQEAVFPQHIPTDPGKNSKAVYVHVNQGLFAPEGLVESFRRADETYTRDRYARFQRMANEIFSFDGLDIGFKHDDRDFGSRDLLVVLSPLNDGKPESDPDTITPYVINGSKSDRGNAKPNSHRPASKLDMDYEFGHAEGMRMPRLQLFAREAPAMTHEQRKRVSSGDMTPYGELTMKAIGKAERIVRERYGTAGFDRIHFFCAGMGAKALGAAAHLLNNTDKEVGSVTLMNLSLGEASLLDRGYKYGTRHMEGEASKLLLPQEEDYVRIPEFTVLSELDKHGAELAMRLRMIKAGYNVRRVQAIMNAKEGVHYIEKLMDNGSSVTVANAINEGMTTQTSRYLPVGDGQLFRTDIVGVDGKKVNEMTNEHGTLVALISNLGLYNHFSRTEA